MNRRRLLCSLMTIPFLLPACSPTPSTSSASLTAPIGTTATPLPTLRGAATETAVPSPTEPPQQEYYREVDFLPVAACDAPPVQHDQLISLSGNRNLLVTTWMPESLYQQNEERVLDLARWADRSTCSNNPLASPCSGLMSSGYNTSPEHAEWGWTDLVVVTARLLLWFDATSAHALNTGTNAIPNGGGGQLRGVWELTTDGDNQLNFKDIRNANNWAPNMLLPGSTPSVQGSGLSGFISEIVEDTGVTFNLENDPNAILAVHAPSATLPETGAGGGTLHTEGFTVQASGHFVDVRPGGDRYLVGAPGTEGHVASLTTYQFAACDTNVYLESAWRNEAANPIGPVVNIVWATNVYGEPNPDANYRNGNLIDFEYTAPETCVVRTRHEDTQGCHSDRVDYNLFTGFGQEYRSHPNLDVPPPSMILRGRDASGAAIPWTFGLHPLSNIVSLGVIFDLHSLCTGGGCRLVSAHDATLFNATFWDSADTRITVPDAVRVPAGIERITVDGSYQYFIVVDGELHARMIMEFGQ